MQSRRPSRSRTEAYRAEFDKLAALGLVYPCYCSRAELHAASAPHASDGTVVYAGTCRDLTPEQRAVKTRAPAWRVRVPDERITVHDGLQGLWQEDLARDCGDFIIRRSDGVYAYQLAVVTDDADGGVTEIVRGRDLLSSTPRQLWLQETLGFAHPAYYHVPLPDRPGRAAAEQAGKGSGPRRAAAASFAAGAARAAGVSGRSAAGAGARFHCRAGGPLFLGSGRVRQYRNSF